jgi:predicted Fe-S protein YdhL (DUF1289 family)
MTVDVRRRAVPRDEAWDEARAQSPCVDVCRLDPATGWCEGCGRTGNEIASWLAMTPELRARLRPDLDRRLAELDRRRAADPARSQEETTP